VNLILVEREEIGAAGRVVLTDRRAVHLIRVLGVRVGQKIRAGIVRGPFASATIVAVNDGVELELDVGRDPGVPQTDLVLGLPRPKALARIVQAAASFGVRRIDIINTWRVDTSYFSSHKLSSEALALDVRLGCEQGRQTYVPYVEVHRLFVPFVEEVLRPRIAAEGHRQLLIAHPGAAKRIEQVVVPGTQAAVVLAIGPDGGFLEREIASLAGEGGTVVNFGQAVLRSETAVVAILSQMELLRRLRFGPIQPTSLEHVAHPDGAAELP
jgi:16S rRNA (uracil1498-N3)-methyltransferase